MNESRSNTKRVTPQKRKREEKAAPQPPSEAEAEEEPKKIVVPTGERAKTQAERKFEEVKRRRVRKILANQFRIFKRSNNRRNEISRRWQASLTGKKLKNSTNN